MAEYTTWVSLRLNNDTWEKLCKLIDADDEENRSEFIRCLIRKEYDKEFNSVVGKIKNLLRRDR